MVADVGTEVTRGEAVASIEDTALRLQKQELQAQIARAEAEARRTAFLNAAAARDAAQAQALARARLEGELKRLATLRTDARPAAERALALARKGYGAGALPYRDLADTVAALYDVRGQELASLATIAEARAALLLVEG